MQALPPFHASSRAVTAAELGASWHAGCPVGPSQLRMLHVSFVGFVVAGAKVTSGRENGNLSA